MTEANKANQKCTNGFLGGGTTNLLPASTRVPPACAKNESAFSREAPGEWCPGSRPSVDCMVGRSHIIRLASSIRIEDARRQKLLVRPHSSGSDLPDLSVQTLDVDAVCSTTFTVFSAPPKADRFD